MRRENRLRVRFELIDLLAQRNSKEELLAELLPIQDEAPRDLKTRTQMGRLFLLAGSPARAADIFRGSCTMPRQTRMHMPDSARRNSLEATIARHSGIFRPPCGWSPRTKPPAGASTSATNCSCLIPRCEASVRRSVSAGASNLSSLRWMRPTNASVKILRRSCRNYSTRLGRR